MLEQTIVGAALDDGAPIQTACRVLLREPIEGREAGPLDLAERTVNGSVTVPSGYSAVDNGANPAANSLSLSRKNARRGT